MEACTDKLHAAKRKKRDCEDEKETAFRRRGITEAARKKAQADVDAAKQAQHEAERELYTLMAKVRAACVLRPELSLLLLDEVSVSVSVCMRV